jgi:hypothetical protein
MDRINSENLQMWFQERYLSLARVGRVEMETAAEVETKNANVEA